MKIYTKKGDKGQTSLIGGSRVPKYHVRIEAYGSVDELNSWLGLLGSIEALDDQKKLIHRIQNELFNIGSILATEEGSSFKPPAIDSEIIVAMETSMDSMQSELPELKNFVLPGGDPANAQAHIARCVCRRAERKIVELAENEEMQEEILSTVNRLSDWLFVLSRWILFKSGGEEIKWQSRK